MYSMYIGVNGGEQGVSIPVLPEKIELSEGGTNKTYEVINLGEVNIIGKPKLTEISFQSFFPRYWGSYVNTDELFYPIVYVEKIKKWRDEGQKIRLILTGDGIQINDLFTIESFKFWEESGQVGDIFYSLDLKRYKNYSTKKVMVAQSAEAKEDVVVVKSEVSERIVEKQKSKAHVVQKGDTLFLIAKRYLGDGAKYEKIFSINRNILNKPEDIREGQILKLP